MEPTSQLEELNVWRSELGLFPVPLFAHPERPGAFVMLNGARGNFCLDIWQSSLGEETRNFAWSANVGHYLTVGDTYVEVQRWDQTHATLERYSRRSVFNNIEQFHSFLEKSAPRQELSVIAHAIRVFRSLRALLGAGFSSLQSVNAFLYLLASITDNVERGELSLPSWRLGEEAIAVVNQIREDSWNSLREEFQRGRPIENLVPEVRLLLRHASGQLFQEAHYVALFLPQQQLTLTGFLPPPVPVASGRNITGVYFTPQALVRTLVEESLANLDLSSSSLTIFDPACGSGEFLRESIRQLALKNYRGVIKLIGWDISKAACDIANFVLAWEIREINYQVEIDIQCVDALAPDLEWPNQVDMVLMNPPFASQEGMTASQKVAVRSILGDVVKGRVDYSFAFLIKASLSLRSGGVLGSILPASLLDSDSARSLRELLSRSLSPQLIARLGSPVLFSNARIDAALYVARHETQSQESAPAIAFWADHRPESSFAGLRTLRKLRYYENPLSQPILQDGFNIYQSIDIGHGDKSWAPRPYNSWTLLKSLESFPRVNDLFEVSQGARTGAIKVFLLERLALFELPENERKYFRPAVVNRAIQFGYLMDYDYIFYPYGAQRLESEEVLKTALPNYYAQYLLPNKQQLLSRSRVKPQKWWELSEHTRWQVEKEAKLVSTYFGDSGSFAWDGSGDFVVVQGYAWLPKDKSKRFSPLPVKLGLAYLAILNSEIFSELLSASSNHVGGGQWDLSKRFVSNIAIPNLFDANFDPRIIRALARNGKKIHDGLTIDDESHNNLVKSAYGINA